MYDNFYTTWENMQKDFQSGDAKGSQCFERMILLEGTRGDVTRWSGGGTTVECGAPKNSFLKLCIDNMRREPTLRTNF